MFGLLQNGEMRKGNLKKLFEKAKEYESASFKGLSSFIEYLDKISRSTGDWGGAAKLIGENENAVRIMSIHKSKGLEFPVVFVSSTGKQFNFQDLNKSLLLHQDMGFGPKYVNYERKIEYSTLAKEALRIKAKNEILSEEMRLLYVALTRSKEKLIVTGSAKGDGSLWQEFPCQREPSPLASELKNAKCYLDWLKLIIKNNSKSISDVIDIQYHNKEEFHRGELSSPAFEERTITGCPYHRTDCTEESKR